jgi:hypothetical protein
MDQYELDHATEFSHIGDGDRYFIIHGPLPDGLNPEYGYPICDSMNRHYCISPEEDEANGQRILQALNGYADLEKQNKELRDALQGALECAESHIRSEFEGTRDLDKILSDVRLRRARKALE